MSKQSDEDDDDFTGDSLASLERLSRLMRSTSHGKGLNPAQWEALRYVGRANAMSNAPGALARYLGATKGTISQTVRALEKKGLVSKSGRSGDGRSIALTLTEAGHALLKQDELSHLGKAIDALGRKTRRRFERALTELLSDEAKRQKEPSFGTCLTCRSFVKGEGSNPAYCTHFNIEISDDAAQQLCIEHEMRG